MSVSKRSRTSHPVLRQKQMTQTWLMTFLVHGISFVVNSGGLAWDVMYLSEDGETILEYGGYGGKFKHLTFWNQIIQSVYFGLALINDFAGSNEGAHSTKRRSRLQKLRDGLLTTIAWPMGVFVVVTFWGIYAVDRELVFPKRLDAIVPTWLNHVMHSTVLGFLILEKYFVYHWHYSRSKGLFYSLGFAAIYQLWILWIAYHANVWVYPILEVLDVPMRVAFFAVLWIVLIVFYITGEVLTEQLWGPLKPVKKRQ